MNSTAEKTAWMPEPGQRGTMSLLWGCFATILICTWSAVHPNVPADDDSTSTIIWRRIRYMVVTIVAPEMMAMIAFRGFQEARKAKEQHATFNWTLTHFFFINMGGFAVKQQGSRQIRLYGDRLLHLFKSQSLPIPDIQEADINDRSKADWVTKSLALIQVTWFVAQLLGRAIQHLPITTLEMFTLGVVVGAAFTYASWWKKPFDVQRPITLVHDPDRDYQIMDRDVERVSLDKPEGEKYDQHILVFVGILFGAIHLAAWDFAFPTNIEKMLWRIGSVVLITVPVVFALWIFTTGKIKDWTRNWMLYPSLFLYVLVRLYMLVEMLIGLRDAPVGVYQTVKWTAYFPSFS